MPRQPIIESEQYINGKEFCIRWKVSPKKLQELVQAGEIGGIRISGILYYDVSKASVLRSALAYKGTHSHSSSYNMIKRKFASDFDRDFELAWLKSQEEE